MWDPQDPGGEARSPGERDDDRELDTAAGIGPRVSAVFTAAEQAAEHILQMARAEVEDLRASADIELEAFRAQRRAEAEREARTIVEDARAEAEIIRTEASRAARAVEDAARRREQWIDEGIRLVVERAEWGRRGLQEVIERLEEFAVRSPMEWPDLAPPPQPDVGAEARMSGGASEEPQAQPSDEGRPLESEPADEVSSASSESADEEQSVAGTHEESPVTAEPTDEERSVAAELAAARERRARDDEGPAEPAAEVREANEPERW